MTDQHPNCPCRIPPFNRVKLTFNLDPKPGQRRLGVAGSHEEVLTVIRQNFPIYHTPNTIVKNQFERSTPSQRLLLAMIRFVCHFAGDYDIDACAAYMAARKMIYEEDNPEILIDPLKIPEFK